MNTTSHAVDAVVEASHATFIADLPDAESASSIPDAPSGEGDLRYIPLSKLVPSPLNVRKSGGTNVEELAMLIDSQGLLQNLIVVPHVGRRGTPADRFEVVAGGRRLMALRRLAGLDKIGKAEPILCKVASRARAIALSVAENSGREAMGMADAVQAYARMVAEGSTVEEVAVAFGITPLTVRRRLKLANVSSRLFDLFRKNEVSLDQLMALAISDDHEAQERVWYSLSEYERRAANLRRLLLGRDIDAASDPVARFVGLEAYEAAGGAITRDLFADDGDAGYIADGELLHWLAKARLDADAAVVAREGWKWVETRTAFDYAERHAFGSAPMTLRPATEKEQGRLDALAAEREEAEAALEALYEDDEESYDPKAASDLERKVERARRGTEKVHAKMRRFAPEVLAIAGAVVTIEHDGRRVVHRGLIKPEDRKEAKQAVVRSRASEAGRAAEPSEPEGSTISEALHRKLTAHRTRALQALLARNSHVALATVVHALAQDVLIERDWIRPALDIRAKDCEGSLVQFADDLKGSKADDAVHALLDGWRERIPGDAGRLLPWLIDQDEATLMQLLALATALTLSAVTAAATEHTADAIAGALDLDMADWWSATGRSFLAQVPKALIAQAVTEAVSAEAGAGLARLKKGEAVAKAETLLAGSRWLPMPLRGR